jgi:hypothetical protein
MAVQSIDAGTANTVTLTTANAAISARRTVRLTDAVGQTCAAAPKDSDLVIASVEGAVITFETDLTSGGTPDTDCVLITKEDATIAPNQKLRLADRSGTMSPAIAGAAVSSIDAGANRVTLVAA